MLLCLCLWLLQAFEVEEQRTKRRRSSATGPDFAAAAAAAIAAQAAAGPTSPGDAAAGQRASTPATPAAGGTNGTALQQPLGGGGGSAGRGVRAYSKQRSGLAAAVAAATGDAGAADEAVFDPIASHRYGGVCGGRHRGSVPVAFPVVFKEACCDHACAKHVG